VDGVDDIDERELAIAPTGGESMSVSSISAAGLGQYVLSTSNATQLQQSLQTLQSSLGTGDLNGALSAFQAVQTLYQKSATASGGSQASGSQLTADLATLGSALGSGDLSTAQSAFAAVQTDLKNAASPAQITEANAASQSVALVDELLSTLPSSSTPSSLTNTTNNILQSLSGTHGGINIVG
jgi:hypothetical protein